MTDMPLITPARLHDSRTVETCLLCYGMCVGVHTGDVTDGLCRSNESRDEGSAGHDCRRVRLLHEDVSAW